MKSAKKAPIPDFESARLKELYSLNIVDSGTEEHFDRFTKLVSEIFNVPITLITLVDTNRVWFKSCVGLPDKEGSRDSAFCSYAIFEKDILVIPDATKDKRFADNPRVIEKPHIIFYAGAILRGPTGQPLGTLCIMDKKARSLSEKEKNFLIQFARLVERDIHFQYHPHEEHALLYDNSLTRLPNQPLSAERLRQVNELETLLKKAVDAEEIEVLYQPIVDIYTGHICGAEALCSWKNPKLAALSPSEFIPLIEKSSLIKPLAEWTLRKVCQQNYEWQLNKYRTFPISVFISQKLLLDHDFPKKVETILKETRLKGHYLDLEITEFFAGIQEIAKNMHAICKQGVTFSLDHVGTGASSLSCIQHLPLRTLKIDKSLITDLTTNNHVAAIVRSIVGICKTLSLLSVANSVETAEQLVFLRAYQCDQIEGKIFSPPVTAKKFGEMLLQDTRLAV